MRFFFAILTLQRLICPTAAAADPKTAGAAARCHARPGAEQAKPVSRFRDPGIENAAKSRPFRSNRRDFDWGLAAALGETRRRRARRARQGKRVAGGFSGRVGGNRASRRGYRRLNVSSVPAASTPRSNSATVSRGSTPPTSRPRS